jgi:hypothetical protein
MTITIGFDNCPDLGAVTCIPFEVFNISLNRRDLFVKLPIKQQKNELRKIYG